MKIWANCIVNNEENFVWFAVMSIIDYVDKVIIYDTGSTDSTVNIIKEIKKKYPEKIEFKEIGRVIELSYTKMRQKMLDESDGDWIIILDGDEIWFEDSVKTLISEINSNKNDFEGFIVPFYNAVGDIFHYQQESAGKYHLLGRTGHLTIKVISKKIPQLHWDLPYPHEGLFNNNGRLIQDACRLKFINAPFLHASLLERSSSKKIRKEKLEIGLKFPDDFCYPEVFSRPYPEIINSPFKKLSGSDLILANVLTPFKKITRKFRK